MADATATLIDYINIYVIDISTKELVTTRNRFEIQVRDYKNESYNTYDIDFSDLLSSLMKRDENAKHGVIAVNNGYVHPLYEGDGSGGSTVYWIYEIKDNVYFGDEVMDSWIIYVADHGALTTPNPNEWKPAVLTEDAVEARLKFGDSPYATTATVEADEENEVQFLSISITEGLMSDSFFSYGSTYSPNCSVTMTKCDYAVPGVWFRVEYKIDGIWQCFGVFKINSVPTKTSDEISFSGVGLIEAVMQSTEFVPFTGLGGYITCYLCDIQGVTFERTGVPVIIDFLEDFLEDVSDMWNENILTARRDTDGDNYSTEFSLGKNYREIWSNLAVALHSNVVERNGVIHIVHIDNAIADDGRRFLFDGTQYTQEPSDMGYYYYASPISVEVNQSRYPDIPTIAKKRSSNVGYSVPDFSYMGVTRTPSILSEKISDADYSYIAYPLTISAESLWFYATELAPEYWGEDDIGVENFKWQWISFRQMVKTMHFHEDVFAYKPLSIELMGYHPCIFPGSRIAVDNGNIVDYMGLVGNVTITYDGALSMAIDTPCDVQTEGVNTSSSGGSGSSSLSGISSFSSYVIQQQEKNESYMEKINPVGTGSMSMNRKAGTTVGEYSTTFGNNNSAIGEGSTAIGEKNTTYGKYSFASGSNNVTGRKNDTYDMGLYASAEGSDNTARGQCSHAEGENTMARGHNCHSEGRDTISGGFGGEGTGTESHAEGIGAKTYGQGCHSEGYYTESHGNYSHSEGYYTKTNGAASHASGNHTIAGYSYQEVVGKYNNNLEEDLFEIGNGAADDSRSNAFRVTSDDIYIGDDAKGVRAQLHGKQNTLVAGDNITLTVNEDGTVTISASGGETVNNGVYDQVNKSTNTVDSLNIMDTYEVKRRDEEE